MGPELGNKPAMTTHRSMMVLFATVLAYTVISEAIGRMTGIPGPYWSLFGHNKFVLCTVYAVWFIHLFSAPGGHERLTLVASGITMLTVGLLTSSPGFADAWTRAAYALALSSSLTFAYAWYTGRRSFLETLAMVVYCWTLVVAAVNCMFFINVSGGFNPILDGYLLHFEAGLGIRIESLANLTLAIPGAESFLYWVYFCLPGFMAPYFIYHRTAASPVPMLFMVSGCLGFVLFRLYPVVGPAVAFPWYYQSIWPLDQDPETAVSAVYMASTEGRNTMPSPHMLWACFLVWNRGGLPRISRWIVVACAFVTVVAALVIGKHWFIDLVVALPVAAALQRLCEAPISECDRQRATAIGLGAILLVSWFIILQNPWFVVSSPGWLRWAAMALTLAGTTFVLSPSPRRLRGTNSIGGGWVAP
jgi:hypothetical protein